jgi:cell division septation protein DedD
MQEFFRVLLWGLGAAASLAIAVFAGSTSAGSDRAQHAAMQIREIIAPSGIQPARPLDAIEGRQLAETVRMLTADRERLLARIAALEHSVDDVTGSIARVEKAARAAPAAIDPPATPSSPETTRASDQEAPTAAPANPPEPEITSSVAAPEVLPPAPEPHASVQHSPSNAVIRRQFGLDLGPSSSEEEVKAAWSAALRRHGALLQSLRPMVAIRQRPRGGAEYRLIAGPIANASKAARFCAAVTATGGICQPTMFDGEKLAIR